IQNYPESHGNLVRPGIMLYGAGEQNGNKLSSVMRLKSKILQIKMHDKGTPVSYGGTYITERKSLIATVPIGYADGYLRKLSNNAFVSIKGKKAKVVGTVCMDFIMIDVTEIEDVAIGDEVTLFGDEVVTINDISAWAETIPYEIMTLVGKRVHRLFV
ncbi:MAG: alanine racemase, partial [Thermodesulfobacteriota bacterium]